MPAKKTISLRGANYLPPYAGKFFMRVRTCHCHFIHSSFAFAREIRQVSTAMCRYAVKEYKHHFVCFECRKGFKKTAIVDFLQQRGLDLAYRELLRASGGKLIKQVESKHGTTYNELVDLYYESIAACPDCGQAMWPMGLDFRVPARTDAKQWAVIKFLAEHGFAFHGCGCGINYTPPQNPAELPQWLKAHTRETEGQKLLRQFLERA